FYYSQDPKKFRLVRNSFFLGSIILLDFFYILNAGLDSSITYAFIIIFLLTNLVLKREIKGQILSYIFFILNLLFMFYYVEKQFPDLITPYPSIEAKEFDLIGSFAMVSFLISVTINFFKSTYEKLLHDIDLKNKDLIISEQKTREEKEKAEHANNAKKDFLSVMSHEIRTPLNAIISISHLLNQNLENKDEQLLKTLKYSSENLLALVSDILDFSKIESGEIKLEEIDFDLKNLIESIVVVHKVKAKESNNELNFVFENFNTFKFLGDPLRLTQIIVNIISNAIKFTKNGSITIKVVFIEDNIDNNSSKIYFEVKDNGIGIAKEKQALIFEKFTQENLTITRNYGGSGLGLAITKNLIEIMNSKIEIDSDIGIGSKFYFYLNLKKSNKLINNETKEENSDMSKIKMLLVEDNKINVMVTTKFFDKWKMSYQVAENGIIALEKYNNNKFDIILMDLQMPEMDGFTATQEIRKTDNHIPIVALTANSMSQEKEKCLTSGFNDYITKPFKPDMLKERILFFVSNN
ncbi:MAG: response regulator, partial [Cyanobacteriota bacterium]